MRIRSFYKLCSVFALLVFASGNLLALPDKIGDLDEDGVATIYDVVRLVNLIRSGTDVGEDLFPFVDVDGDGFLNDQDVAVLTDIVLGRSSLSALPFSFVRHVSPTDGEGGVAVTRETKISLTMPLSEDSARSISGSDLYATFGGEVLTGRINVSPDRKTLTLFYDDPLPPSARVRVTLDGTNLTDSRGRILDVDGDGVEGGILEFDFDTLSLTFIPGTSVCGRVFASELTISDGGEDPVNQPLEGVTITVDGMEDTLFAVTDNFGNFRLDDAPVGRFFVHVDGRTATVGVPDGSYYPFVGKPWVSVAGEETNVGEVFLPLVSDGTLQNVSETEDTVVRASDTVMDEFPAFADVAITVPAGSLYKDDGSPGGMVGIAPVDPDRLPGTLPEGLNPPLVITVQTDGATNFDEPAPICFPNLPDPDTGEIKAPGEKSALVSFNHDSGEWEVVGPMTVSADGKLVCTDPGVGILAPGWHADDPRCPLYKGKTQDKDKKKKKKGKSTGPQNCSTNDHKVGDCDCVTSASVFLHSGEEMLDRTDLYIPGRGDLHFEMTRVYRSQLDYDGPIGFGWTFTYDEGLFIEENGDITRINSNAHIDLWELQSDGSYKAPEGHFRHLIRLDDGSYLLRDADGFQRYYDEDGRLFCYRDRYDNIMLIDHDEDGNLSTIIDVFGREIQFFFETFPDGIDRLVRIRDFADREVVYSYDSNGNLVSVRSPVVIGTSTGNDFPLGRTERYTYSSGFEEPELNHNLLSCTMPQEVATGGPPAMVWTYGNNPADPSTFDKVTSETIGGTNASGVAAGGTRTFAYEMLNQNEPAGQLDLPRGKATVTERNGNVSEFFVNERNHHILTRKLTRGFRDGEPAAYETRSFFNDDGLLVRRVYPEGNEVVFKYDVDGPRHMQHNRIERREIADVDRGGGEDLVTTYTYEPLYNQTASTTDPRGNATGFSPPLGDASTERYSTRYFFDYQESNDPVEIADLFGIDLSGVSRGLGDLNGDGRTDQMFGNMVRNRSPSVLLRPDSNQATLSESTEQEVVYEFQWNDHGQIVAEIDEGGNVKEYTYYPENDPDGDGTLTFSPYKTLGAEPIGYLAEIILDARDSPRRDPSTVDPIVQSTSYTYDMVGNIVGTLDPRGILSVAEVNALNEVVTTTRGFDVSTAVANQELITGEDPLAYRIRLHYDHNGRIIRREVENSNSNTGGVGEFIETLYSFDILGNSIRIESEVDANSFLIREFRYDENENPELFRQAEGNEIVTVYDERDLVFTVTQGAGMAEESTSSVDYDLNGNRIRETDAEDNDGDGNPEETIYNYDGFNRVVEVIDALGNSAVNTYDVASNVVRTQILGHPAGEPNAPAVLHQDYRYAYDELNRVFQNDKALFVADGFNPLRTPNLLDGNNDGFVTDYQEYDSLSRLTHMVEDDGQVIEYVYDGLNREIAEIDAMGNMLVTDYDANDNPIRVSSVEVSDGDLVPEEVFETHYVFDQLNRIVRATDNAGQTSRFSYDSRDNLISMSDPVGPPTDDPLGIFPGQINEPGNTSSYFYDGLNRTVAEISDLRDDGEGSGQVDTSNSHNSDGLVSVIYEWDGNSRLSAIVDDNGNRTSYHYDALNRLVQKTNAKTDEVVSISFDRDSNPITLVDPNGTLSTRLYDALNRLVSIDVVRSAGVIGTTSELFEYDGIGRLTSQMDDNGNPSLLQSAESDYDSLGRILEERQNGQVVNRVFSGDGNLVETMYPGGRSISREFDILDRVIQINDVTGGGSNSISRMDWVGPNFRELRRLNGNGTKLTYLNSGEDAVEGYDAVKRTKSFKVLGPGGALLDRNYGFNRANIRMSETRGEDGGLTDTYTYDSMYRLIRSDLDQSGTGTKRDLESMEYLFDGVGNRRIVSRTTNISGLNTIDYQVNEVNQFSSIESVNHAYSLNGNLLDDGNRKYSYDYKNRLVSVEDKNGGANIATYLYHADNRRAVKIAGGDEMRFFYDGWQVCEEQNDSGSTQITYVYSPGFIDTPLQLERTENHPLGAGSFYYHQNDRYDVVALSDTDGAVVERRIFDDFGVSVDGSKNEVNESSLGNPYGFQGRRLDSETGLYYFRQRYYNPEEGRFLQRDPVQDPMNVGNQYTFVGNSPASRVDPYGLDGLTIHIGVSGQGGAGAGGSVGTGLVLQLGGDDWIDFGSYVTGGAGAFWGESFGGGLDLGVTVDDIEGFRDTDSTVGGSAAVLGGSVDIEDDTMLPKTVRLSVGAKTIGVPGEVHAFRTKTQTYTLGDLYQAYKGPTSSGIGGGMKHELGDPMDPEVKKAIDRRAEQKIQAKRDEEARKRCEEEKKRRAREEAIRKKKAAELAKKKRERARRKAKIEAQKKAAQKKRDNAFKKYVKNERARIKKYRNMKGPRSRGMKAFADDLERRLEKKIEKKRLWK